MGDIPVLVSGMGGRKKVLKDVDELAEKASVRT
jgi:hypothetical protein